MVKETRIIFDVNDVVKIRIVCTQCKAEAVYPGRSNDSKTTLALNCPGCGATWAAAPGCVHPVRQLFDILRTIKTPDDHNMKLRFEIEG